MRIPPEFYDADYFENGVLSGKSGYSGYNWTIGYSQRAQELQKYLNPKRVIDIGCAKGFMVYELRKLGIEAYGIDISEYAIANAHPEAKPYVKVGNAADLSEYANGQFDLAICYDILEHLNEDEIDKALDEVCRISGKWITVKCPFEKHDWDADKSHIGIRSKEEWIAMFSERNFQEVDLTAKLGVRKAPWTFWDNRTLFFARTGSI